MNFDKTKTATLALILMLTFSATILAFPLVSAHDPPWEIRTYAFVSAAPNPVGVGQQVIITGWLDINPPTAQGISGDRWRNIEFEITKPDGSIETFGPYYSDPVGSKYLLYTPDQIGTYSIMYTFPGQVLSTIGPTGIPMEGDRGAEYVGDTFLPSSATFDFTVQQEPIEKISETPYPTEYWTRPIEGQNSAWGSIASNWVAGGRPGRPFDHYNVQPDGIAPNSAHIMWTKPLQDGGIVGGSWLIDGMSYYSGHSYELRFINPMIIHGRLYFEAPLGNDGGGGGYVCLDLRTGETIWKTEEFVPEFGQLFDYESQNQHGVLPTGYLWDTNRDTWDAYDSLTGKLLFTLTNVPSGSQLFGPSGEILIYELDVANNWLALWNNTQHNVGLERSTSESGMTTEDFQWRPIGKTVDMSIAYSWNVTIPAVPEGSSIVKVFQGDIILGRAGSLGGLGQTEPYTMWAISLKPESRGVLLWTQEYTQPEGNLTRQFGPVDSLNRVFTIGSEETMQWWGYSLDNGNLLWGPVGSPTAWQFYSSSLASWDYSARSTAYGNLYVCGYGGLLYCYDTMTGELLWTYGNGGTGNSTNSGIETPYGNYPVFISNIADEKLYLFTYDHSITAPMYKGVKVHCVDAITGEGIWTLAGWPSSTSHASLAGVIADGYFAYFNTYDNQIYCIGKGPSETTVSAPDMATPLGSNVLIKGSVIDLAAGTKEEQAARFPKGVAAVSDESMGEWMEYVYMQKPCPENAEGVEVVITTYDPNGNTYELGRTTTSLSGTFGCAVDPPVPGLYKIIATFEGSESYYGSYAETYLIVEEPTSAGQQLEPETLEPSQASEAPFIATELIIILAVVIVAVIALSGFYIFRKHNNFPPSFFGSKIYRIERD